MDVEKILSESPEHATHFDGKTYFRFEMYEHGQAYLVIKNGMWDRGLPAYPVYGCHSLADLREILELREQNKLLRARIERQQQIITGLEEWVACIADSHNAIPDWIQQSARSLLAQLANKG